MISGISDFRLKIFNIFENLEPIERVCGHGVWSSNWLILKQRYVEGLKIKDSQALLLDKCMHRQEFSTEISG